RLKTRAEYLMLYKQPSIDPYRHSKEIHESSSDLLAIKRCYFASDRFTFESPRRTCIFPRIRTQTLSRAQEPFATERKTSRSSCGPTLFRNRHRIIFDKAGFGAASG